jgi:hypothetical protein
MSRVPRWAFLGASLVLAVLAVALVGLGWKGRADEICRKEAPATGSSYTLGWKWDELAYVCDYQAPSERSRRVGVIDAFHSGDRQRHRR